MLIFTEDEIRQQLELNDEVIEEVESAFKMISTNQIEMPPTMRVNVPNHNGEIIVKTALITGLEMFALKVSSHFFNNFSIGFSSTSGVMMLMNALNGKPEAFFYDNGFLTDLRTGAAGAIAAKYLANDVINKVGVIGTGSQAKMQLMALKKVRDFKTVYVYGRTQKRMGEFKQYIESALHVDVHIVETPEQVVKSSELLITATPSNEPIVRHEWVPDGMHITAVGADADHKQELDPEIFKYANIICCDVISQSKEHGELREAFNKNILHDTSKIYELGNMILQKVKYRKSSQDITIADLTGTGAQDTKIALYAYKKLTEEK
ncbi:ornithine cyclodeaminase family protein [Pseudogracilibacillus sp. SE30717A]|uniref:ornithine cyclodeaminase family protein n=1 Tax=Pseudogracilibacillus sp. SE30717A TaxID=3098293 RepID=UPI00300DCFD9